jgi:hypothetical protein
MQSEPLGTTRQADEQCVPGSEAFEDDLTIASASQLVRQGPTDPIGDADCQQEIPICGG